MIIVETMLVLAGMSPITKPMVSKVDSMGPFLLTNSIARAIRVLLAIRQGLAPAEINEVFVITGS